MQHFNHDRHHNFWKPLPGYLLLVASILGLLVLTNPDRRYYEAYVTDTLSDYLIDRVCSRLPEFTQSCHQFIVEHEEDLLKIVSERTQRDNFWLFSLYQTEIELPVLPMIEIRAIGGVAHIFPYDVQFPDGTDEL